MLLPAYPCLQIVIFLNVTLFTAIYSVAFQPFQSKSLNVLEFLNELVLLMTTSTLFLWTDVFENMETKYVIGWYVVGLVIFSIVTQLLFIVLNTLK